MITTSRTMQHRESGILYKLWYKEDGTIFISPLDDYCVPNGQIIHWKEDEIQKVLKDVKITYDRKDSLLRTITDSLPTTC